MLTPSAKHLGREVADCALDKNGRVKKGGLIKREV